MESTLDRLKKLFSDMTENQIDLSRITPESTLKGDLAFSSLNYLWMLFAIENEFGIDISDLNINKIHKVKDIISFIDAKLK